MKKLLLELVNRWDTELPPPEDEPGQIGKYTALLLRLEYFAEKQWARYLPVQHPSHSPDYLTRLWKCLAKMPDENDKRLMFEFASYISFFSQEDFWRLYQSALEGPITRWVISLACLSLRDVDLLNRLELELHHHTWYCPITDSMNISEFYHANRLEGVKYRPAFSPLAKFGDPVKVAQFMRRPDPAGNGPELKRIVLLEDFVGSGTQSAGAIHWAAKHLSVPVLFAPLIVCPKGAQKARNLVRLLSNLTYQPVMELAQGDLLGPERGGANGHALTEPFEEFCRKTFQSVAGGPHVDQNSPPFTPFGFRGTGCSVVTYSNTPNNTVPLIHHGPAADTWSPIFPRSKRN